MAKLKSWMFLLPFILVLPVLVADAAEAQEKPFSFEARGGIAVPIDDTNNLWEAGPSFQGSFVWWATESVGLRAQGGVDLLSGKSASELSGEFDVPDMTLLHYTGGLEFAALPRDNDVSLSFLVGAGATTVSTDDFPAGLDEPAPEESDFSETYVTLNGGTKVGYRFHESVTAFLAGQFNFVIADDDDLRPFPQFDPQNPEGNLFDELWTIPVTAGVEIHF